MNQYKSSADLKDLAKEKLSSRYGTAISAFVLVECITYLISSLIASRFSGNTITQYLLSILAAGVVSVFAGLFQTGTSLLYLNIACGQPYRLEDILYGITHQPSRSLTVSLVHTLVSLICMTPYQLFMILFFQNNNLTYLMLMFVSAGIGLLIDVPISLMLSQSYYLLLDFPEYSGLQALSASYKLMKGHKARLFYIRASFLPLILLCTLSLGLGLLWLTPYMNMTYTLFFLDIMNPGKATLEQPEENPDIL